MWGDIFQGACRQASHQRVGQEVGYQTGGLRGLRGITGGAGVDWGQNWFQMLNWPVLRGHFKSPTSRDFCVGDGFEKSRYVYESLKHFYVLSLNYVAIKIRHVT